MTFTKSLILVGISVVCVLVSGELALSADQAVLETSNPLLDPWRISHFPELEGRGLRCIAEDQNSDIWFGLRDGVVRYDGYEWQDFGKDDGLPGTEVSSIVRRSSGQLIAATEDGLFEQQGAKWRRLFPSQEHSTLETSYAIETNDAAIWACTRWGLLKLKNATATLYTSKTLLSIAKETKLYDEVIAIPDDCLPRNRNYSGSDIRLLRRTVISIGENSPARSASLRLGDRILAVNGRNNILDALKTKPGEKLTLSVERHSTGQREEISFITSTSRGAFLDPAMNAVMQDRHGAVWAGTVRGTLIMSPDYGGNWKTWTKSEAFPVESFPFPLETSDGSVWAFSAGRQGNANRYDGREWSTGDLSMLGGKALTSAAAQTADGTIWVGGLSKLHMHRYGEWTTNDTRDLQFPSDSLSFLVASDQALWIGGYNQAAVRIAIAEKEFLSLKSSQHLCTEASGTQWFVNGKQTVRKDGAETASYGVEDGTIEETNGIAAVPGGVVAFGSHNQTAAVSTFRDGIWNRKLFPKVGRRLSGKGFTVTRAGTVWIGTMGERDRDQVRGVVHGVGDNWEHFAPPDAPHYCTSILELPDGRMWFGGGYGIIQYDGENWTRVKDELLRDTSCPGGTIDSRGTVYLATRTKGVLKYKDDKWTQLSAEHGLLSNEVSTIHADFQNRIWVTTPSGISRLEGTRFTPVDLPEKLGRGSIRSTPDGFVWIDGVKRLGHDSSAAETRIDRTNLTLAYDGEVVVAWHGVDRWNRTASDKLQWSWRLDGGSWSDFSTDRQVTLRHLDVGDHAFEVVNRDGDSNPSSSGETIAISVLPPFWLQPWFVSVCCIAAALLIWQAVGLLRRGAVLRATNQQLATARTLLANRFADQTAQFRAICDCSPVGIFVTNAAGETTYVNKCLIGLSDIPSDAPDASTWLAAVHDEDRMGMADAWHEAQAEAGDFRYSARFQHRDGSIRWFEVVADRVNRDGIFRGYVGVVEDITERHLAGEEIKEANLQLRSALGQLEVAQEQAIKRERLNALGQMAAGVAHDINNTLTPLMVYAELLQQDPTLSAEGQECAELLRLGVSDTADTVRRLNHFYRPSHNQDFAQNVDIADIARQTVELTKPKWFDESQASGKSIDVKLVIEAEPFVRGESSQLRSVLTNLIFNSVDAITTAGQIIIRVEQNAQIASIEVSDSGIGMDTDQLNCCTDPFYTSKNHGSGLGLSECLGIIRQHGGELNLESVVEHGTKVRFDLPCVPNHHAEQIHKVDRQSTPALHVYGSTTQQASKVLFIDDNEQVLSSTCALMSILGVRLETAKDGAEGLEKLARQQFRFVLLDQGMPGMDGLTVLRKIKELWPDLPVVMVSGWTLPALEPGCGPDEFIEKPFSLAELKSLVEKYIPRSIICS